MKRVVVIGGGTGTFVVLTGLREYPLKLSVVVSMMDSGGSTGKLRDQLGVLPPGDLRQCLVALSNAPEIWRKIFLYRFEGGDLNGHNFGNILLSALEKNSKNYNQVIDEASKILGVSGEVIPVTFSKAHLCVKYQNGKTLRTEGKIDTNISEVSKIVSSYLSPAVSANKKAVVSIMNSNFLVIGPGDMFTSLIPNLLVKGVRESIKKTKAKIIYVVNLMTKRGQTNEYSAKDHVLEIEKYLGKKVDYIILNNAPISPKVLRMYTEYGETAVKDDLRGDKRVIRAGLVSQANYVSQKHDKTKRSILRHDSKKLAKEITKLISK